MFKAHESYTINNTSETVTDSCSYLTSIVHSSDPNLPDCLKNWLLLNVCQNINEVNVIYIIFTNNISLLIKVLNY